MTQRLIRSMQITPVLLDFARGGVSASDVDWRRGGLPTGTGGSFRNQERQGRVRPSKALGSCEARNLMEKAVKQKKEPSYR